MARNALTAPPAAPPVVTASGNDILDGDARYGAFHRFIEPDELRFSGIQIADLRLTQLVCRTTKLLRRRRTVSIPQRFESDRTPSRVEDRLAKDPPTSKGSLLSDLRFAIHVCHSPQCGRRSRRVGDTAASPGDSQVFKRYSQVKLQMKREALEKINRQANEMPLDSGTPMVQ